VFRSSIRTGSQKSEYDTTTTRSEGLRPRNQAGRATEAMTAEIHCCREEDDLAKAIRHMEELKVRRLPVINKSKRMTGILSLGDVSHSAAGDLLSECVKSVSAHHH
jgi:CBS domain-containing protein